VPSRVRTAFLLRDQAAYCSQMGSALYAHLLERAAEDAAAGGPVQRLLEPHDAGSLRADALALRLMAAVHRLVLTGEAPRLARHYPTAGGRALLPGAWEAFRQVVIERDSALRGLVARPCQTNEVGRCAALAFGFLELGVRHRRPLRLLEVGASAGLNLRFDHYRYGGGGASWGPADSPVDLSGLWLEAPPRTPASLEVAERRGCDLRPIPLTAEGRLTLESSLWADQASRLARLRGAFEVARRVPAAVEAVSIDEWLPRILAEGPRGVMSVVFHSIVDEYLSPPVRRSFRAALARAGAAATRERPLAWLRFEPTPASRGYGVALTTWPGGEERLVATARAHGSEVRAGTSRPSALSAPSGRSASRTRPRR
jgi:hypothetical protein